MIVSKELREAGVVIDDGELSLIALNSLDESYDSFVTSQTARIDEIPFASLLGCLRSYENHLSHQLELKGMSTANIVQTGTTSSITCQICDKRGHTALACYNRHNEQRFLSKNDRGKQRGCYSKNSSANVVWYLDSGASDHVTSN